ncbi:MAG: 50S ribosomal protein L10 [Chitinispirillaceae bacterium]|nr:50S ribosomal protein L10 [Chitinispirillaceae bacterium]
MSIRTERTAVIETLEKDFREARGIFLADYHKINVDKITQLRANFRKAGVRYIVVKNKLAQNAVKRIGREELVPFFKGPTAVALSKSEGITPAKIIRDFQKENKNLLQLKIACVDGAVFSSGEALRLADLPGREVLLAQLLGCLQAPLGKLAGSLYGILAKLVGTLTALKDKQASL